MSDKVHFSVDEGRELAMKTLIACGTSEANAAALTEGIIGAELDGISSHGFMYLPIYCEHVKCGKIDGNAKPELREISASAFAADAKSGFAHPAILSSRSEVLRLASVFQERRLVALVLPAVMRPCLRLPPRALDFHW